jgi:hypothetical protein
LLTFEAPTFKYFLEPIVWEHQGGSMTSDVVHTWQLTAAYYQHVFVFLISKEIAGLKEP